MIFAGNYHWELLDDYVERILLLFISLPNRELVKTNLLFFVETLAKCNIIFCDGVISLDMISVSCEGIILSMSWSDDIIIWSINNSDKNNNYETNDYWAFDEEASYIC